MTAEQKKSLLNALQQDLSNPEWHYELGRLYLAEADYTAAQVHFLAANTQAPNHPQILLQLGNVAAAQDDNLKAIPLFKQSLSIEASGEAWFNLGNALRRIGQSQEALQAYQMAMRWFPNDPELFNNIGNVMRELGDLGAALQFYQKAVSIAPHLYHALAHLVHQQQHACDWLQLESRIESLREAVRQHTPAQISPFAFLSMPGTNATEQLDCASMWVKQRYSHPRSHPNHTRPISGNKIRLGYLSADFRLHPLAFLITELIEAHNRAQFEVFAFSYSIDDHTPQRQRLVKAFDHFIDIRHQSIEDAAQTIEANKIDILIDLTGFTQNSLTAVIALRPAKIMVNWLGFPGTMGYVAEGRPLFDYILTDRFIHPPSQHHALAEQPLYLEPTYQPNSQRSNLISAKDMPLLTRKDCGLPAEGFVFCCFNQSFKITPEIFKAWCTILQRVPNSVLWLLESNRWAKENLTQLAQSQGVAPERLVFAPRVSFGEHLARHQCADLFLDTTPYNAHTSCSDALWMDLPVLTLCGETFPSRVAGSLLHAVGLDELITFTLTDYVTKAIEVAESSEIRKRIIATVQQNKNRLFDSKAYVKGLEQHFMTIFQSTLDNNTL